ncbi:MAG: hypothetical protein ABSA76_06780 [Bacteroidales bacterium]
MSGNKASFYSVKLNNDNISLIEHFLNDNIALFKSELRNIVNRLKIMGETEGAREHYFRPEEGIPGDRVCALYDSPEKNLRLYCIRFGTKLVLLGSGGYKPKKISALQQDPKLKLENKRIIDIVKLIEKRMEEGEIWISSDGMDFEGNLDLKDNYYED